MTPSNTKPSPPTLDDPQAETRNLLVALAREIAYDLEPVDVILARKGITKTQYEKIENNPFFKSALASAIEVWNAGNNAENRLRIQAAYMAERAMPQIYARMMNANEPLPAVNDSFKTLLKTAGIGERAAGAGTGEKFLISINLGAGKEIRQEVTPMIEATATVVPEGDHHARVEVRSPDIEQAS